MNDSGKDSQRGNSSKPEFSSLTSESSISDDERAQIEHVLEHGSPPEASTPSNERIVVIDANTGDLRNVQMDGSEGGSSQQSQYSWINRIKTAGATMFDKVRSNNSTVEALQDPKKKKPHWKAKLWTTWNNIKYSSTWMSDRTDEYGGNNEVIFLGRCYFTNIDDTETTSDCGWGCMIRTTQMMTAHAILLNRLGRDWRFIRRKRSMIMLPDCPVNSIVSEFDKRKIQELKILKLFEDKESAPLGIHRLISISAREKGPKAVGMWYTPSESVHLMKKALSESISPLIGDISLCMSIDGKVHIRDIEVETKNWSKKLILAVVVRLGAAELNPIYVPHLQFFFAMESCLGISGGRPDHSSWFVGCYGDQIIYLDPHVAHEYIPIDTNVDDELKTNKKCAEKSYHCKLLSKMNFLDMDPSCAICFRFENREQFDKEIKSLNLNQFIDVDQGEEHGMKRVRDPLFSVVYGERRREDAYDERVDETERQQADQHGFELL